MIAEEKEQLSKYYQICAQYQVQPDPIPEIIMNSKTKILNQLLKILSE